MKIAILDPSYVTSTKRSPNLGDQVISRAVSREIQSLFPNYELIYFPTKSTLTYRQIDLIMSCDYRFVSGSNLLWFRWWKYAAWKINLKMLFNLKDLIFFGVGWGDYKFKPNAFGRFVCSRMISKHHIHSFRDEFTSIYAVDGLNINKSVNTICPTMWQLDKIHCERIPKNKSDSVLFTLTDYSQNKDTDSELVSYLIDNYKNVYFFPQGDGDLKYLHSLKINVDKINSLNYDFESFVNFVEKNIFDYVGTRLHAGIFCLEHFKRSFIIGIDNRAIEINKTTDLPVVIRGELKVLDELINSEFTTKINLPVDSITKWRNQFNDC